MTNKERAKKIKKLIGFKRNKKILFSRPADIIADLMHYCDHYFDHESLDSKYDFENELRIAKEYYNDEDLTPSENLFFKITILPFGGFNTPNLK